MTQQNMETVDGLPISDGFDFPVGPRGDQVDVFKTHKIDATLADPNYMKSFGVWHPGEDWNGKGGGDTDLGQPVYAISHGRVLEFGDYPVFGKIVLLEHILPEGTRVWSQYAHLDQIMVNQVGQQIVRSQQVGAIGKGAKTPEKPQGIFVAHLHFEIRRNKLPINSWTPIVHNRNQVLANYYSPTDFIKEHRPPLRAVSPPAVKPSPVGEQLLQVIVDSQRTDINAGVFHKAGGDNWFSAPYGYQGSMIWTYASPQQETNWAEWRPYLPAAGRWAVEVFIPDRHATTTQARYRIGHADGLAEVALNQSNYHNQWARLGVYRFEPGQGSLRLSNVTGENQRDMMIGFDAARWVKAD